MCCDHDLCKTARECCKPSELEYLNGRIERYRRACSLSLPARPQDLECVKRALWWRREAQNVKRELQAVVIRSGRVEVAPMGECC